MGVCFSLPTPKGESAGEARAGSLLFAGGSQCPGDMRGVLGTCATKENMK